MYTAIINSFNKCRDKVYDDLNEKFKINIIIQRFDDNFIHKPSGLIFDKDKKVIAKYLNNIVLPLNDNDIEICNMYKFDCK